MKWAITAKKLVELKRDVLPHLEMGFHAPKLKVTPKEIKSQFKKDNPRNDLLVLKRPEPKYDKSFRIYADEPALKKDLKKEFNLWFDHSFDSPLTEDAKHRYEIFCGGWLQYYDIEVRNGDTEHVISFEWTDKKVNVYISPTYKANGINIYLHMNPPGAGDPPKPPSPPPY